MKKRINRLNAIAAVTELLIALVGGAFPQKSLAQAIGDESADQLVQLGQPFTFSVSPALGNSYQWLRNGMALIGETNSYLSFQTTAIADAGYYSCNIANGGGIVPTITAYLEVFTLSPDLGIVVYGTPITSSGSLGTCPGAYAGYVNYTKTAQQGWGWAPVTNTTVYTASDNTRTNTKVEYVGDYGDSGCNQTTVTVPYPAFSPVYRFTIYFTNNVPTTNYPITLIGFNP